MNPISSKQLLTQLEWRYATKKFDPTRRIPRDIWADLERSLVLTPSSYGLQPWKFIVVQDPKLKSVLTQFSYKQQQPADCSDLVVFAAREFMHSDHVDHYVERTAEVRNISVESLSRFREVMVNDVVSGPRSNQAFEWATRQAYIALGQFMASCALLGIDACPMDGFVPDQYDRVLNLTGTGFATVVVCAAGYRAVDDKYAITPKVRFPVNELVIHS